MIRKTLRAVDRSITGGFVWLLNRAIRQGKPRRALHIHRMSRCPIFIGGCGRSGTTMMLSLLSAHHHLHTIPYETHALTPGSYPPTGDNGLPFDIFTLYTPLLQSEEDLSNVERWCEKTPGNIHFTNRILEHFGSGARFIHKVRDGRNVVTSRHPYHAPDRYWVSPERWVRDVEAGRRVEGHPQVLTVRYEDMVGDYMAMMRNICDFIEEPFARKAFESYPDTAQPLRARDSQIKYPRPIRSSSHKRWQKEEHKEVVEHLLHLPKARDYLGHYGYL